MDLRVLERIKELRQRLSYLRCQGNDATSRIGIEAIQQELARTAAQLPREWDLVSNQAIEADETPFNEETRFSEDDRAGSRWWL